MQQFKEMIMIRLQECEVQHAQVRKAMRVIGSTARVSAASCGLVMNMKMRPNVATTMDLSAMLIL